MILVALGSNLETREHGTPRETLEAALKALPDYGIEVVQRSSWYRSAPVPVSDQPWYVNGAARVQARMLAEDLLARLHEVESRFGRIRRQKNESRVLDLDLLTFDDRRTEEGSAVVLPHPRIAERAFVLKPLVELVPSWHHPVTGETAAEMLRRLPASQAVERIL
ncbi:2-amino-4-hydroxy-6-hydroxymethyldihydropteridine diphosphokinase [Pelagibius sp.]|uniref:2-amino-4-hydroxy-6- hydroxymethyldihydropteridine diphosphokinase n=1 Tax=Pelagibius sp. TaxID=1931238 RepID=UPI003B5138E6